MLEGSESDYSSDAEDSNPKRSPPKSSHASPRVLSSPSNASPNLTMQDVQQIVQSMKAEMETQIRGVREEGEETKRELTAVKTTVLKLKEANRELGEKLARSEEAREAAERRAQDAERKVAELEAKLKGQQDNTFNGPKFF